MSDGSVRLAQSGSAVLRVDDTTRRMHLASLLPVTRPARGALEPLESRFYYIAGGYFAMKHFNERSNAIVPDLAERLEDCDLQLSVEYRDTQFNRVGGARVLNQILERWPTNTLDNPFPSAIVGSGRSDTSETVSTLSSMFQLPMVSPHSSAASLDDKGRFPYFARTTPSAASDGKAAVDYMHFMQASHIGVIYVLDTLGIAYDEIIQKEAREVGMTVYSIPYRFTNGDEEMRQAFQRLKATGVRYIFAAIEPATWKQFIKVAVEEEIIGTSEHFWLFHSGMVGLVPEELDIETEYDIVRAIHGSGVVLKDFPPNPLLDKELQKLETDINLQRDFINLWSEPEQFDDFSFRYPGPNYPQYINYDAVMALGLAACAIDKEYFTGDDLYAALIQTEFPGASDYVSFDAETGSRKFVLYRVDNILMVDKGQGILGFRQEPAAALRVDGVDIINEFVYWDNTTKVPLVLPPFEAEYNYIPTAFQAVGTALGCLMMLASLICIGWTLYYRSRDVVKASQPFFLMQLCIGTLLMTGSIIPMSFQEPTSQDGLDVSCMLVPWLFVTGYVVSFSALLSKSWRINKLFSNGTQFRRVQIRVVDALFPLAILLSLNVLLLTLLTFLSPLRWERVPVDNFDSFGRSIESYGICKSNDSTEYKILLSLLVAVNLLGLVVTNYQGYRTRNLPTAFDESYYVALSNAMLLESLILGFPVMLLVEDSPSAAFIVKAVLVSVLCVCILLPVFGPKHLRRNKKATRAEQVRSSANHASSGYHSSRLGSNSFTTSGGSAQFISGLQHPSGDLEPNVPEQPAQALCGSRIIRRDGQTMERIRSLRQETNSGKMHSSLTPNSRLNADQLGPLDSKSSGEGRKTSCLPSMEEDPMEEDRPEPVAADDVVQPRTLDGSFAKESGQDGESDYAGPGQSPSEELAPRCTMTAHHRQSFSQ